MESGFGLFLAVTLGKSLNFESMLPHVKWGSNNHPGGFHLETQSLARDSHVVHAQVSDSSGCPYSRKGIRERRVLTRGVCTLHIYAYLQSLRPSFPSESPSDYFSLQHFRNCSLQRKRLVAIADPILEKSETQQTSQN